jgi:hypothetical protein
MPSPIFGRGHFFIPKLYVLQHVLKNGVGVFFEQSYIMLYRHEMFNQQRLNKIISNTSIYETKDFYSIPRLFGGDGI